MTEINNTTVETAQGADNTIQTIEMMFPTSLVKKLENLFQDDKIDFNKVLFTVFWINRGKYNSLKGRNESFQEVSSRYGNWLSLKGKQGKEFLDKLIQGNIIKKVSGYVSGKQYTRYRLVMRFSYKGKDATKDDWELYTLTPDHGAFARKYITDKWNVIIPVSKPKTKIAGENIKNNEVANPTHDHNIIEKMNIQEEMLNTLFTTVAELKAEIEILKDNITTPISHGEPPIKVDTIEEQEITYNDVLSETPFFQKEEGTLNFVAI